MMTVDAKGITVPSWVLSVVAPLFIVVVGYFVGLTTISAKTEVEIEHLQEEVIELKATKASDEKVDGVMRTLDDMQESLNRIEQHILN